MGERLGHDVYARLSPLQRPSDLERLGQIRCDSLVVRAKLDQLRSLEESQDLATALHADLAVIQGGRPHDSTREAV